MSGSSEDQDRRAPPASAVAHQTEAAPAALSADRQAGEEEDANCSQESSEDDARPWDEYKLIQDKIDKIGDFHFRVRSWAITLTSAIAIGGFAKEVPWYVLFAGPLSIFAFQMIDKAQTHWQKALMQRADQIERQMRRQGKGPRIVQVLRQRERDIGRGVTGWPVVANASVFYLVMYLLSMAAIVVGFCVTGRSSLVAGKAPLPTSSLVSDRVRCEAAPVDAPIVASPLSVQARTQEPADAPLSVSPPTRPLAGPSPVGVPSVLVPVADGGVP